MRNRTLIGCSSLFGGSPLANSIAVMPSDQMSACGTEQVSFLRGRTGVNQRAIITSLPFSFVFRTLCFREIYSKNLKNLSLNKNLTFLDRFNNLISFFFPTKTIENTYK